MAMENVSKGRIYFGAAIIWLALQTLRFGFWLINEPFTTVEVDGLPAYPIEW